MGDPSEAALTADERQADREALRALLREVTGAINRQEWEAVFPHLGEDVVVTLMDQVPLRGHGGLREYLGWIFVGANSVLTGVECQPVIDAPAIFYGDTAVFTLTSRDRFSFRAGREIVVRSSWTGTMVHQDGAWKLAVLHGGVSPFENPISAPFTRLLKGAVGAAGVAGGLLGFLIGRRRG